MRNYIAKTLSQEYELIIATNGEEAFQCVEKHRPDLVISDVMMPVLNGFELLKKIRSTPDLKMTPLIFLSARAGQEEKTSGVGVGADDYLVKPFSVMELKARIQTQLSLSEMRTNLLRELAAANKELESFSYSTSHDLRAPLRSIAGFVGILKEDFIGEFSEKARSHLDRIEQACTRMSKLIDALLELARYSRGTLEKSNIDLSGVVNSIVDNLYSLEKSRKIVTRIQSSVNAYADPSLIQIALENLMRNAWKYTGQADQAFIEFGVKFEPSGPVYFIKDNGVGFDMAHVDRLFQPFERLHSASEFEGTGIGLATTQRIIHRHGGKIWAEGQLGKGACFYFTLA